MKSAPNQPRESLHSMNELLIPRPIRPGASRKAVVQKVIPGELQNTLLYSVKLCIESLFAVRVIHPRKTNGPCC